MSLKWMSIPPENSLGRRVMVGAESTVVEGRQEAKGPVLLIMLSDSLAFVTCFDWVRGAPWSADGIGRGRSVTAPSVRLMRRLWTVMDGFVTCAVMRCSYNAFRKHTLFLAYVDLAKPNRTETNPTIFPGSLPLLLVAFAVSVAC